MDRQGLVTWIKGQRYVGKGFQEDEEELSGRLYQTLDRFVAYLRREWGIERIEGTTLEALQHFDFDLPANDDQHLGLAFDYLDRQDLAEHMSMVSADKYFRNKMLVVVFKEMDDLKAHVKSLRNAGVRMASELLERGAWPEGRAELAEDTGIPVDVLLRMVRCCDLCRMMGMAGRTLRRSMAMGYDSLDAFRQSTPERIEAEFQEYLRVKGERTSRMVSFTSFIHQARRLEDVVVG